MAKKTHEKMLTIPGHKGKANQNHNQKHHQQQMLARMQGKKESSYTAGGNVN
jgi:hypothetical protein